MTDRKLSEKYFRGIVTLFLVSILLISCNKASSTPPRQVVINQVQVTVAPPTAAPHTFKTSDPGFVTVHGTLNVLDPLTLVPAPGDSIFLVPMPTDAPISGIPPFEVGKVPQAEVDESTGEFLFTNISPGQYAVEIVTSGGAQIPVRFLGNNNYAIFTLDASQVDKTIDVGQLSVP